MTGMLEDERLQSRPGNLHELTGRYRQHQVKVRCVFDEAVRAVVWTVYITQPDGRELKSSPRAIVGNERAGLLEARMFALRQIDRLCDAK